MIISDNTQGNKYHADDGKFTSPDAASLGLSVDEFNQFKANGNSLDKPIQLVDGDLDALLNQELTLADGDIEALLKSQLSSNNLANLKFGRDTDDIKENIKTVLGSKEYIEKAFNDLDFSKTYVNQQVSHEYYKCSSTVSARSNPIVMELCYQRYPKKAKVISKQEYDQKMAIIKQQGSGQLNGGYDWTHRGHGQYGMYDNIDKPDKRDLGCGMIAVWRGFEITRATDVDMRNLKLMYTDMHDYNPILGQYHMNSGSVHYFTQQRSYANGWYSDGDERSLIKGIINLQDKPNVNIITVDQLNRLSIKINNDLQYDPQFRKEIEDVATNMLGGDAAKAYSFVECFMQTLQHNKGLVGLLSGAQAVVGAPTNGSQFDLYDLSLLEMIDE